MKKILSLTLAAILLFSLTACGTANTNDPSAPTILQNPPTVSDPTVTTPTPTDPTQPTMSENVVSMMVDDFFYQPQCYDYPYSNYDILINFRVEPDLYPDKEITVDITIDIGRIYRNLWETDENGDRVFVCREHRKNATLGGSWGYYWRGDIDEMLLVMSTEKPVFVTGVVRADGNIVGYCLYEIGFKDNWYMLMRSEMMLFPMVDGQIQYISEEYIADIIAQRRAIVTPVDLEAKKAEYEAWWQEQANKNKQNES